jgi:hypothetical protein
MLERKPLRLAGAILERARHTCAFFNTKDEEYRVLLPFIKDGLDDADKGFHIVDPDRLGAHLTRLTKGGIDVDAAQQSGQLEIKSWQEAYLRGDRFDQDAMLELIQEVLDRGKAQGYALTRFVANMEWALEDLPGVHDIVEYEARLNYILPRYDDPVT